MALCLSWPTPMMTDVQDYKAKINRAKQTCQSNAFLKSEVYVGTFLFF